MILLETPGEAEQIPEFCFLEGYRVPVRLPKNKDPERGEIFSSGRSFADICDGVEGKWSIGRNRGILTGRPCETKKAAETIWVISWL